MDKPRSRPGVCLPIAVLWIIGSILGTISNLPWWVWVATSTAPVVWLPALAGKRPGYALWLVVPLLVSAGRSSLEVQTIPQTHVAHAMGRSYVGPLHVQMVVDRLIRRGFFIGRATAVLESSGSWVKTGGRIAVSGCHLSPQSGSTLQLTGRGRVMRYQGRWSAFMEVFEPSMVCVLEEPSHIDRFLSRLRSDTQAALVGEPVRPGVHAAMVSAVTFGTRDHAWNLVSAPFRATGTAHLLAVSGLHLAILCGLVLIVCKWIGAPPRRTCFLVILMTIGLMTLGDVRTPLARAGIMVVAAAAMMSLGWRVSAGSLWSMAVLAVLWRDPLAVLDPSFQLSFGVVAALIWVLPVWSARTHVVGAVPVFGVSVVRVSVLAWLVASPIAAHHFGVFSPIGVPATLVLTPLVAAILWSGYMRVLMGWCGPLDSVTGWFLDVSSSVLWWSVEVMDALPGTPVEVAEPGWWWVLGTVSGSVAMLTSRSPTHRRVCAVVVSGLWAGAIGMDIHSLP